MWAVRMAWFWGSSEYLGLLVFAMWLCGALSDNGSSFSRLLEEFAIHGVEIAEEAQKHRSTEAQKQMLLIELVGSSNDDARSCHASVKWPGRRRRVYLYDFLPADPPELLEEHEKEAMQACFITGQISVCVAHLFYGKVSSTKTLFAWLIFSGHGTTETSAAHFWRVCKPSM